MSSASLPRRLGRRLGVAAYARRLRRSVARAKSLDELVQVVSTCRLGPLHIRPMQIHEEIRELLELLSARPPRAALEIGTARGGTLCLLARVAAPDALLISVDLPEGPFGGGYPVWKGPLYRSFARPGQRVELIRGASAAPRTRDRVERLLGDRSLDFVLIDGDHSYRAVQRDFETYAPLVRPGGMVAFHDIHPGPPERVGGVPRFWSEIRSRHPHREILAARDQLGFGVGVLQLETSRGEAASRPFDR
jgi:predicted O-methyltransferase YrrM